MLGWTDTRLSTTPGPDGRFYTTVDDPTPSNTKQVATQSLKMSYQMTPKNRVLFVAQPTVKHEPQRNGSFGQGNSITRPLLATVNYHAPGFTYKGEVQTMFNNKTLLDVNVGRGGYQTHYSANDWPDGAAGLPEHHRQHDQLRARPELEHVVREHVPVERRRQPELLP